jgi:5-methyltetrahydropteroyltriglutamate--homocysteine methyltransferase
MTYVKTTHVGSLPRPAEMMAKLVRRQEVTTSDLKQYLTAILERQLSLGITYVNNGELPRMDYVQSTVSRIAGFGATETAPMPRDLEELPELSRRFGGRNGLITLNPKAPVKLPACSEPLAYTGEASLREELDMMVGVYEALKPSVPDSETGLFFTSPSPGTVALFMENKHYPDDEAYMEAIASVLKQEYDIIAGYGLQLQVDCPDLAMGRHTRFKNLTDREFIDRIHLNVRALNQALDSVAPDRCRIHICWGNYPGTHHCDIDLETIFNPIMKARARYVSLEASNHRHAHEWEIFKEAPFPEDKVLMPGVIDTSSTIVEHPDLVAQRVANFINILGADRVIASTDCGFATTASASAVSGEVAWMKLATLVEGTRRAGQRLS